MPKAMYNLIGQYIEEIKKIYGSHVRQHRRLWCTG